MNCGNCGSPTLSFAKSRKNLWKGRAELSKREASEQRSNLKLNPCKRCGKRVRKI